MAKIRVISPDGRAGSVEESDLPAAQKAGYRPETPDDVKKRAYEKQGFRTGVEGVARTVSFGLSDPFLKGAGVPVEDIAGRREANPEASFVGELSGAAMPFGAAKLIGRAERAVQMGIEGVAPTITRKLVAKGGAGLTGGSMWGLGASISENTLEEGDKQLAGEKLLAMGGGGLTGAGLAVIEGGLGIAGRGFANKVFGKSIREKLSELAEETMVRQIAQQSDFKKFNLFDRRRDVGRYALEKGWGLQAVKGGMEGLHSVASEDSAAIGDQMGQILKQADERVHGVDTARIAVRAKSEILDEIAKDPLAEPSTRAVQNYVDKLNSQSYSFDELWQMQRNLRKYVGPTEPQGTKDAMWKLRKIIRDELIDQSGEISPHFKEQLTKLNKDYGYSEQIEGLAEKRMIQQQGNRYVSPSDYIAGAAGAISGAETSGPKGVIMGGIAAMANKLARERGGFVISEVADRLSKSKLIGQMADGFKKYVDKILRESPELLGAYRVPIEQAAARGAMDLLGEHVSFMQHDPDYPAHIGVVAEPEELASAYVEKGEKLSTVGGMLQNFDAQAGQSMDRFLGKASGRPPSLKSIKPTIKDFNEKIAALNDTLKRGGAALPTLNSFAPGTAMMLQLSSVNTAKFLLDKAPKNPFAGQMAALARPWEPSTSDLQKWYRYVEAVERPQHVLDELTSGMAMPEHVEALASAYPKLLNDLRQKLLSRLSEHETTLPYSKRLALSSFLGTDILGLSSEQLALMQGLHQGAQQSKVRPSTGPNADGRQNVNAQENLETQAQRMEKRT